MSILLAGGGLLLVFAARLPSQGVGSVRGVVTDQDDGVPLPAAWVVVAETGQRASTSDQGLYVIPEVPAGRWTVVVTKDGWLREVRPDVVVTAGRLTELEVALAAEVEELDEFVTEESLVEGAGTETGLLQLRLESPALMDSISADLLSRAGASDAAGALRLVAGATVQDGKSAVIRGLPDRYVSSQLNGVRLPTADEDKRAVELDQFPAAVIESIQVSKTFTPDQQGDASGGAVNVRLKRIPEEPFSIRFKSQVSINTQAAFRDDFLSYDGGGISFLGRDDGRRDPQFGSLGSDWDGAVGVVGEDAPIDHKWSLDIGGRHDLGDGLRLGGSLSLFYERDSSYYDDGIDDSWWVTTPGAPMSPQTSQGSPQQGDFRTSLFDVTRSKRSLQRGLLATAGIEDEDHAVNLSFLHSLTTEDTATLAEDTRGKEFFFPGHDPNDPNTPGHAEPDAAPYLRLETLDYTERTTGSVQLAGRHRIAIGGTDPGNVAGFLDPEVEWRFAGSFASVDQPDKRQFGTAWFPERQIGGLVIPATHRPFKPSANFNLGNLQRIFKEIEENSLQAAFDLRFPFRQWSGDPGYVKTGLFADSVDRSFDQDTFSNFNDNSSYEGEFNEPWSAAFPSESHPISASDFDVDYDADQDIFAWYLMADVPLTSWLKAIGGARVESTEIGIRNLPEPGATWFPAGSVAPTQLNAGDADAAISQTDVLPSIALEARPLEELVLRAAYNGTIARQTFKELTPILQQEFLGSSVFIGNPSLQISAIDNYDLRADWTPWESSLVSASWFRKEISNPIEYVQRLATFNFTTAVNYPEGELSGFEFEIRQSLGRFSDSLEGVSVGVNATLIDAEVRLPEDESAGFNLPGILVPTTKRDMTNAPGFLFNAFVTWDLEATGTQVAAFYTLQGDTLLAGAGQADGNFVPDVYATEFDTLNFSLTQRLGDHFKLQFQAKNLTNADVETVYRSGAIGRDVRKTLSSDGIDLSLAIGGEFRF